MKAHVFFWPVVIYAFVYYWFAKKALKELGTIDLSGVWRREATAPGIGRSSAILRMLFDGHLPRDNHPATLKRDLYVARVMLALSPVVLIAMIVLIGMYASG